MPADIICLLSERSEAALLGRGGEGVVDGR